MKKTYLIIVFLGLALSILCYQNVLSQTLDLKFQRISKENGLSTSAPTAIIKDSKGFIWIASQNGLNRFDGSGFKCYNHNERDSNSISDDYIMCLCEDSEGNIQGLPPFFNR